MVCQIRNITVDSADPHALARWWEELLGYTGHPENAPEDTEVLLLPPDGIGPNVLFIKVPESKAGKNRLHLDIQPTTDTRDGEVAWLLDHGATQVSDFRRPDGTGWVTLADPEGNEFCVVRSAAERDGS